MFAFIFLWAICIYVLDTHILIDYNYKYGQIELIWGDTMPKTFNESERVYIRKRLIEEAQSCLKQYGVRKTTVDEIVKRVNIPKGTFYLFYESKELLFFDVFCSFHDQMQTDLMKQLEILSEPVTATQVTELLFYVYKKVEDSFLYQFMTNGDMELLMRKLPPEVVKAHADADTLNIETFLRLVPNMRPENSGTFAAAFRAIFLSMLHKREIGEEEFDGALKMMLHGVVLQMYGGAAP